MTRGKQVRWIIRDEDKTTFGRAITHYTHVYTMYRKTIMFRSRGDGTYLLSSVCTTIFGKLESSLQVVSFLFRFLQLLRGEKRKVSEW
jgi:hypothetical protein